jgi:hypothetical integral membrane protein (TIGR02206 family)
VVRQFSPPHLAALAVLLVASVAGIAIGRRWPGRPTVWLCRALAVTIIVGWAGEYVADVVTGIWSVHYDLPLQLTDTISVTTAIALWTRHERLGAIVYLWALSASLQATITPDLAWNFPSVFYFTYFIYHEVAIVGGLLLVFGRGRYPTWADVMRTFGATLVVAGAAGTADALLGSNYMYLAAKPVNGSLLSDLGPWPWYIAGAAAVAIVMLVILEAIALAIARHDPLSRNPADGRRYGDSVPAR